MNALPIRPLLSVEEGVFVLRHHLLFTRHLSIPPLNRLGCLAIVVLLEGSRESVDDRVNSTEALPLASFLRGRESPRDFPR